MNKVNRRTAMAAAIATGASVAASKSIAQDKKKVAEEYDLTKDQEYVMAAGMTKEEADCWKKIAEAAGAFFNLPELHPMDKQEVASAVHIIQNKLLSRPTYREYVKLAKAGFEEQQKKKNKKEVDKN